ncbi:MAG: hypothetical protein ICCCNLDF_03708 [Planctomycetes bacterium]|nr:hypothetical protein [Planctomycetota bacterium]
MNHRHLLIVLLVVLLLGGAAAWFIVGGDASVNPAADVATERAAPPSITPLEGESASSRPASPTAADAPLSMGDKPAREAEAAGAGQTREGGSDPAGRANTGDSSNPGGSTTTPASGTPRQPKQQRQLTPAEREEQRREATGRPALAEKLRRSPVSTSGNVSEQGLSKSTKQDEWEEQWYAEGFTPPEMTPTPVRGKVMSQEAREGLAKATVGLISFFPLDGVAGGPLLPVITEFTTDDNGFFSGEIPASKLAPLNYPPVALVISYETYRIVAAMPIDVLEVGRQNEFGIFWAPETPFTLETDARQFTGELSVVSTGELNPQRWYSAKRAATLSYFPAFAVAKDDPKPGAEGLPKGSAILTGTWDGRDEPYVSLLSGGQIVQTRRPARAGMVSSKSSGGELLAPFDRLVFENDALTPIGGQVLDGEGAAVANAVVFTVGDVISQSALTDAAGWFYFEDPPEKTSALRCTHADFVETQVGPVSPGDPDVRITLAVRRPRIQLYVTDRLTQIPLTELSVKVIGLHPWGKDAGKPMPEAFTQLTSSDGHFLLEWEYAIKSITLEKLGYFPRTLADPVAMQTAGELQVELSPGRKLEVRPRDYTGVEQSDRWFKDAKPEDPGIYTAWSHHWIEWEVDFGDAPAEGEEGGSFDVVLGCTNRGIVDNDYQFEVDVYLDGVKKGKLVILADSLNERTARMSLGKLSGAHTVRLVWTNDKWIPEQLDANIRYASLKFLEQP